jgi:hypothetical protein
LPWLEVIIPIIRHPYRFLLIFAFAWSMIGAYGWLTVEKALKVPRGALLFAGLLVGLLILLDYAFPQFPHRPVVVSPFYTEYLEAVPNDEALAIIPFGRQEDKRYLFYQTLHEHPITGGHISRSEAETLDFINQNPLLRAGAVEMEPVPIPDNIEEGFRQLADVNVHYFIIDKNLMVWAGRDFEVWRAAIPFFPIYEDDLLIAYKTTRD